MKSIDRMYLILTISTAVVFISCGAAGVDKPSEPTNEDAIYNIIRYDRAAEFNIDLLDLTIPDTALILNSAFQPLHFWRKVDRDSLFIDIRVSYPEQGAPTDSIPIANVSVVKFFWGSLEIIGIDTSNGGSIPVRLSKPFTIKGAMTAYFAKMGFDYNTHRGWLLRNISDASFTGGYIGGISSIVIHSTSYPNQTVNTGLKPLSSLLQFARGESLTVDIRTPNPRDFIRFRYPSASGAYIMIDIPNDTSYTRSVGFSFPNSAMTGHFFVDVLGDGSIDDTAPYRSYSVGVLFKTR